MRSVYIEAGVDEIDIGKIKTGQRASVLTEAFPGERFSGTIIRIAPEAKIEQNVTLFDVIVKVSNESGKIKSGMNASIEIIVEEKKDILLVPTMALTKNRENVSVKLKKGSRFELHEIETGLSNFKVTEVLNGLQEGDVLGIPMDSRLKQENDQLEQRIRRSRSFGSSR